MNNSFILFDKNNNIEKKAQLIVKFDFNGNNYLVYSIEENEQNSQILVSKLVLNSEGNYFIDDISAEEKVKLSNIVYNIIILIPSDVEKGNNFQILVNNLFSKFSVKLLSGLPSLSNQEYYSNCSIAITNKILVENAVKLYNDELNIVKETATMEVPMWTAPVEVTAPTPIEETINNGSEPVIVSPSIPVQETVEPILIANEESELVNNVEDNIIEVSGNIVNPESVMPIVTMDSNDSVNSSDSSVMTEDNFASVAVPNPQAERLAIVSDLSLGIGVMQPNVMQNKKAGFANTKYVVIGTVCLVLAIAVIITAYILIKNMG